MVFKNQNKAKYIFFVTIISRSVWQKAEIHFYAAQSLWEKQDNYTTYKAVQVANKKRKISANKKKKTWLYMESFLFEDLTFKRNEDIFNVFILLYSDIIIYIFLLFHHWN